MKTVTLCPVCAGNIFTEIHRRYFNYSGGDIEANISDSGYVRRWILFDRILNCRNTFPCAFKLCKSCGVILLCPRPEENDMQIKYDLIRQLSLVQKAAKKNPPHNKINERRARIIHRAICKHRPAGAHGLKILDFGGAAGYNLKFFSEENECFVVDYEKWTLEKNVNYLCSSIEQIPDDMKFDIILCCHILEHLIDPIKTLKSLVSHLTDDGVLYAEVPSECCVEKFNDLGDPLTHINFFSIPSFAYFLSSCGLRPELALGEWRWLFHNRTPWLSMIGRKQEPVLTSDDDHGATATIRQMKKVRHIYFLLSLYGRARTVIGNIVKRAIQQK